MIVAQLATDGTLTTTMDGVTSGVSATVNARGSNTAGSADVPPFDVSITLPEPPPMDEMTEVTPATGPAGQHFFASIMYEGVPGTGDEPVQWFDGATPIPGATWPTYVPGDEFAGTTNRLRCRITGTSGDVFSDYVNVSARLAGTLTGTVATRTAVWASAQPGDVIEWEAGDYPDWVPAAKANTGAPIIMRSADTNNKAQFRGVRLNNLCQRVIFEDLNMEHVPTASTSNTISTNIVNAQCSEITFKNCIFTGGVGMNPGEPTYIGLGIGKMITLQAGTSYCAIIDNKFHTCRNGVMTLTNESNWVTIRGNTSWNHSGDTYQFAAVAGLNFTDNVMYDYKREGDDHPDGVQFQTQGGTRGMSRCYIGGNIIHSGAADKDWTQSYFLSSENTGNRHSDVIIENNLAYNAHYHGITLSEIDGVICRHNTIIRNFSQASSVPGTEYPHINILSNCTDVTVEKNVVDVINNEGDTATLIDNYIITYTEDDAQPEFVGGLVANSTMAQLQPTALLDGYGATYTDQPFDGGPVVPGVDPIIVTPYRYDRFVFTGTDLVSVQAKVRGTGTPNAAIEWRGESAGGNTAWYGGVIASDGTFDISGAVPFAQWGNWYTAAVRYAGDDASKSSSSNTFGCGKSFVIFGQSEAHYVVNILSTYNGASNPAPASVLAENGVWVGRTSPGSAELRTIPFDTVNYVNNVTIGKPMMHMFNMMSVFPGKVCFIDGAVPGTGQTDLFSDSDLNDDTTNNRDWQEFEDRVNLATDDGWTEVSFLMHSAWYTNDNGSINQYGMERFAEGYTGQRWDGSAFTLGDNDIAGLSVDHCLWDFSGAGRGLFSTNTKLCMMPSNNYVDYLQDLQNSLTFDDGSSNSRIGYETSTASVKAFFDDPKLATIRGSWGPSPHVYRTGTLSGTWGDSIHPDTNSPYGNRLLGMHFAAACLKAIGYGDVNIPYIDGFTVETNGAYMDVNIALTEGQLSTSRAAGGYGAPTSPPAHYNPVMGFEILRNGDALADMTPSGFTTEILSAANGTVRITPDVPFAEGDTVYYSRGGKTGPILSYQNESAAAMCLDMLIETSQVPEYDGVPVSPQTAGLVVGQTAPPTGYSPVYYGPVAEAPALRAIYHSQFTGVPRTGVKKMTKIITYRPGANDGSGANTSIIFSGSTADMFLATNSILYLRTLSPQQTVGARQIFGVDWRDQDFAFLFSYDTTQAVATDRIRVLIINVTTGATALLDPGAPSLFPALNADLNMLTAGLSTSWFSKNVLGSQSLKSGGIERLQMWANVAPDLSNYAGLYANGALINPSFADNIAAAGGGSLGQGQRFLDVYGNSGFINNVNRGLGSGTTGAPTIGPNVVATGAELEIR